MRKPNGSENERSSLSVSTVDGGYLPLPKEIPQEQGSRESWFLVKEAPVFTECEDKLFNALEPLNLLST